MIFSKVILFTGFIFYQLLISRQTINSVPLQTDLNDPPYTDCVQSQQDNRPRIGYYLNSLLNIINNDSYAYKAFSATVWLKPKYQQPNQMKNYFGIYNDITNTLGNNVNGFSLYSDEIDSFRLTADYFGISQPRQNKQNPLYNSTWYKAIILYQPLNKLGYARVMDSQSNTLFTQNLDFSNLQTYFIHYLPGTSNINTNAWLSFNHGVAANFNSCSKQKYAMFHYSNDETFSLDDIQAAIFDNYINYKGYLPIYYFSLKVNNIYAFKIGLDKPFLQRFKNIYAPNKSEAINGQTRLQDSSDILFSLKGIFKVASFSSGQYIQLDISLSPYQFMISFIFYYQSITSNGITIFSTDTNSFSIKAVQSTQPQLQIILPNSDVYAFNLGQSGSRHTIAFSLTGPNLFSNAAYYVNTNLQGSITFNSQLASFTKIFIGSQSQPNDSFQIQDLYFIPNSDLKVNFPTEPTFAPKNCGLFYSFNLNFSYCFTCILGQENLNYYGQCTESAQNLSKEGVLFYYSYFGTNFISIIDASSDPTSSSLTYNYQISNNQFDFLVLGYYQTTQWKNGQLFTSLAYLQVGQTFSYYFLNLYLESVTKITLKLTLDSANLICYQSINYQNSILNQWVFLGFGYKTSSQQAYLVYQDKYGITQSKILSCQGQTVGTDTKSFKICLGCQIPNSNKYTQFIGKIKNVKIIEGFNDYSNINQYMYLDQDIMDFSASNINYFNIYSLKYLYAYSLPDLTFACQNGYYFLEGICVSSCSNIVRSLTPLGSYNNLYANTTTQSCEMCPQNCLTCFSSSICLSCRAGFVIDYNSKLCVSCSQGTFYDSSTQTCVQTCTGITDLMNFLCITNLDSNVFLNSLLFFNSQILNYNEGFQIMNSSNVPQQDTYAKCQGNNPYSFFMFYGGESLSSSFKIQKKWSNLPNNYSKVVKFNVVLFNFSSLDDLQVYLNGQVGSITSKLLISQNANICASDNQQQIQAIYQVTYQVIDNLNTLELIIKYSQNGFGVRNIQISVNKCHQSCNMCQNGPNAWNCISCQRLNNIVSTQQCICDINEYYKSNQCYSSPCYSCSQCSIKNCLRCEDETGNCLICRQGYSLIQGNCVQNCSQQPFYSTYSINSQLSFCYLQNSLAFNHFQPNKIINNLEFWQISVDYVSQNGLINCLNQSFLPNLGNVNGVQDYITLQILLKEFQSKYRGILFDINLVVIDNITLNSDYILFQFSGSEVKRVTYQGKPAQNSTCINTNYQEQLQEVFLPIYKGDGEINLKIQSLFNDNKLNESFTVGEVKAFYIVNEPLCTKYSFDQNYSTSICSSCSTNSSLGLNNQCSCNDGYFFQYIYNILDGVCVQCNPLCSKCFGPSAYDCLLCQTNYYYQISTSLCVNTCETNEFIFINTTLNQNECHKCDNSCLTCIGPNKTDCLTCSNNFYLDISSHLCVEKCQSNQYQSKNQTTGQILCMPCNSKCLICKGPNQTDCINCSNNYFLNSLSNLCVQYCESNQFQSQNPNTGQILCMPCDQACLTCQGANKTDCITCSNNFYQDNKSNLCVPQCQPNQYQSQNPTTGQILCMSCDQTCLTCNNQGRCLSCTQGQFLYNNQCVLACPNNYQINQSTNTCDLCSDYLQANCQTCDITCKQCIYGKTDNNSCNSCYETKYLVGQQCQCKNKQDNRNNHFQCSYLNVAVLDIYLSSNQPLLTIEFGSPLQIISQYSTPSQMFCNIVFDAKTQILIGDKSTCSISGSQILVNLANDSTIMENADIKLNSNILSFQGQKTLIGTYYKTTVSQQYPGKSQLVFSYINIQNSCNDTTINFKQFINDAQRGLLSINWSIVSLSKLPNLQNQQSINKILQQASQNTLTTLIITRQLIPVESILTLSVAYTFKVNQTNMQTLQIQYSDKQIQVQYIQSVQPPFQRYMGIFYSFTFFTQICEDNKLLMLSLPTDIQITSSNEIKYLQKTLQNYSGQNLEINILQYTLPPNQLSFFNVSFSLSQSPNITTNVSIPLQVLSSPIFIMINASVNTIVDYRNQLILQGTSRDFDVQDPNSDQGITLTWSCQNLQNSIDSNCYDYKKQLVQLQQGQNNISISGSTFTAYSTLRFTFSGVKGTRQKSSSIVCIFSELDLPTLSVSINYQDTYNINEDITAILSYNSLYSSDILTFAGALLYDNNIVGALKFDFYKVRFRIWDYFSNLNPGENSLQIRFSVFNPYFSMPSTSTIDIILNFPPTNCQFTVSPQSGFSLTQVFTLCMLNCQDENEPLTYQFFYYNSLEEYQQEILQPWNILRRQIQELSDSNTLQTILPQGNLLLMAQALDSKLAVYNSTLSINVLQFSSDPQVVINTIYQNLQSMNQLLTSQKVINLNIIAEELSKNSQVQQSQPINNLKQAILAQQLQQTSLLPSTSLLQTFTSKAAAQLLVSGYQNQLINQNSLLNEINQNLQNLMNLINNNKINQLQQDNNLIMQNLVDYFKILNATSLIQSSSTDQLFQIDLANQIGEMIINITMIENQGSIYLQGRELSLLVDRITEKQLFHYAKILSQQSNSNETQSYSVLYNILTQNIFYNTNQFQIYVKQLQKYIPNLVVSSNEVITPRIKHIQSQKMLNDSMFLYQFNTYNSSQNQNLTCIQKLNDQWQPNQCQAKKNQFYNSYTCVCQTQSPTTLVESIEDVLLNNNNLKTVFGNKGLQNLKNFTEPYKYTSFWLLTTITLLQLILWYFGIKLDKKSLHIKLFQISPESQIQTIYNRSVNQIILSQINFTRRRRRQKMSLLQNLQTNQLQKSQKIDSSKKRTFEQQITETDQTLVESKQIKKKDKTRGIKIIKADPFPFKLQNQFSQESQEENQKENLFKKVDTGIYNSDSPISNKINIENLETISNEQALSEVQTPLANQNTKNQDKLQLIKMFQSNPTPTQQASKMKIHSQEKSQFQNQTSDKNEIKSIKDIEEKIIRQESYKQFIKKKFLMRMMVFHNFISIFLLYDEELSRPFRFSTIYLNVIHSMAMSLLFTDYFLMSQKIFISLLNLAVIETVLLLLEYLYKNKGFLQIISNIFKMVFLFFYYYSILAVVSGKQTEKDQQFIELFLISTGISFVVYQFLMASFKNVLIIFYFQDTKSRILTDWIYNKLNIQGIIDKI